MSCQKCLLLTIIMSPCILTTLGCTQKNITCEDIKQAGGYKYLHGCPAGSVVHVDENKMKIAFGKLGADLSSHKYQRPDMRIDDSSFFTSKCSDLNMKCITNVDGHVKDICLEYKITELTRTSASSDSQLGLKIGVPVGSFGLFLAVMIIVFLVFRQRISDALHARKKNDVSSKPSSCCPVRVFQGTSQNGNRDGNEDQAASSSKEDNDRNTDIERCETKRTESPPDDNERNNALEGVEVQSDPQAGGSDTLSHHHIFIEEETKAKDGDTTVPDEVPNSRDMHRNQRDDPGGVNGIRAVDTVGIKKMQNGWTHGERGPEDDEKNEKNEKNERELLLPIPGGANQRSDMTGEDTVLVDESCFGLDLDSKSIALDTDVESAHYVKNHRMNIY